MPFVPDGETVFSLPVAVGESVRNVEISVDLEATLEVPMPDMVRLTHHPAWTEQRTESVRLYRPGTGRTVSRTVTVSHGDGTTSTHTISAYLSVPGATVTRNVTLTIEHEEHVRAEVETPAPIERTRTETLALSASLGADAAFRVSGCLPGAGSGGSAGPTRGVPRTPSWRACRDGTEKARDLGAARGDRPGVDGGGASGRCGDDSGVRPCADRDGLCRRRVLRCSRSYGRDFCSWLRAPRSVAGAGPEPP